MFTSNFLYSLLFILCIHILYMCPLWKPGSPIELKFRDKSCTCRACTSYEYLNGKSSSRYLDADCRVLILLIYSYVDIQTTVLYIYFIYARYCCTSLLFIAHVSTWVETQCLFSNLFEEQLSNVIALLVSHFIYR